MACKCSPATHRHRHTAVRMKRDGKQRQARYFPGKLKKPKRIGTTITQWPAGAVINSTGLPARLGGPYFKLERHTSFAIACPVSVRRFSAVSITFQFGRLFNQPQCTVCHFVITFSSVTKLHFESTVFVDLDDFISHW